MPSRVAWVALGAGAYAAFALSLIPASTAYRLFAPEQLRLSGIDGTLWSGSAALGSAAGFPLHDIGWNVQALPLLIGRVAGTVEARLSDGFVETAVSAGRSRIVLRDLQASTNVAALQPLLPLQGAEGLLSVSMERLEVDDGWPTAAVGQARVAQLAVPPLMPTGSNGLIPLGNYEITFTDAGDGGIAAQIRDTGGPLQVTGRLTLGTDRAYALEGLVAARADAPAELVQGLELMTGEPDAEGMRAFSLTGSL